MSKSEEFNVVIPKDPKKKFNVMKFNSGGQTDVQTWKTATLSRDLSARKQYETDLMMPEFGAGSEFGRRQKLEARRLKMGGRRNKGFVVENQPWSLKVTSLEMPKDDKKDIKPTFVTKEFQGKKEGGIGEGSMYFVMTQTKESSFEVHPVQDWCVFKKKITHRTLTDEEAEREWNSRDKILNKLNFMARKRLALPEPEDEEEEESTKPKKSDNVTSFGLKVHDNDDDVGLMSSSDDEEDQVAKKKREKQIKKEKMLEKELADEGKEDSDDGDNEGNELQYDSDVSSEDEIDLSAKYDVKGIEEMSDMSSSSDDEEEEIEEEKNEGDSDSESDIDDQTADEFIGKTAIMQARAKNIKSSFANKKAAAKLKDQQPSDAKKEKKEKAPLKKEAKSEAGTSSKKRPANGQPGSEVEAKRAKMGGSDSVVCMDRLRELLRLKPITIAKILKKFKQDGVDKGMLGKLIGDKLRLLKLKKIEINGKMHLHLKD